MEENIKTTQLGHTFNRTELKNQCRTIFGGVSWPGKKEGFAVVAAMNYETYPYNHKVYLLDEYESFDMRELVNQCGVLDFKYCPERWIGDYKNDAAVKFIYESNPNKRENRFSLTPTPMLEMEHLYSYILPQIKELSQHSQLFLKESKIVNYLRSITESEIPEIEYGEYPAIEALAFAVLEILKYIELQEKIVFKPPKEKPRHIGLMGFDKNKRRF
jgi:hypothetical protein